MLLVGAMAGTNHKARCRFVRGNVRGVGFRYFAHCVPSGLIGYTWSGALTALTLARLLDTITTGLSPNPVWTENSVLAFPLISGRSGGCGIRQYLDGLSLAELRRAQSGPFISDRSGESGVPDSYLCVFLSQHWLANSYCSHHPPSSQPTLPRP